MNDNVWRTLVAALAYFETCEDPDDPIEAQNEADRIAEAHKWLDEHRPIQ